MLNSAGSTAKGREGGNPRPHRPQPLVKLFAAENQGLVDALRRDLEQGQRETAGRRLHRLRGGASILAAEDIIALSERLEMALKCGEPVTDQDLTELERALQATAGCDIRAFRAPNAHSPGHPGE